MAGAYAGLTGCRSAAFWPFWDLVTALRDEHRAPTLVVVENVCGTLTSRGGRDFAAICAAFGDAGYNFGALVVDAVHFVPQSRPRLFAIAVRDEIAIPSHLTSARPSCPSHSAALKAAYLQLPAAAKKRWLWWHLPLPARRNACLADLIEESPSSVPWHTGAQTQKLLAMMNPRNRAKVRNAVGRGDRQVGTLYKRTRREGGVGGMKTQRAEVRFDGTAGCLRTPSGGSSRQFVVFVDKGVVKTRLISSRETARLMGIPDDYVLPENYNQAYHLTGDGVVVPVVRYLADQLLEPIVAVA